MSLMMENILVLALMFFGVKLLFANIILFDSIAIGAVAGYYCNQTFSIHPALCTVLGLAVALLLMRLQYTKYGFWIIGGLFSAAWAVLLGCFGYGVFNKDVVWGVVVGCLVFIIAISFRFYARGKLS